MTLRRYKALDPDFVGGLPHYSFAHDDEVLELPFESMRDAPEVGESLVMDDGRVVTRILPPKQRVPDTRCIDLRFKSHSLPLWYPYHKGAFDSRGRACFESRAELDEMVARANHHGEHLQYDHPR